MRSQQYQEPDHQNPISLDPIDEIVDQYIRHNFSTPATKCSSPSSNVQVELTNIGPQIEQSLKDSKGFDVLPDDEVDHLITEFYIDHYYVNTQIHEAVLEGEGSDNWRRASIH